MAAHNPVTFTKKRQAGIGLLESQGWVALKDGKLGRCPAFATLSCEAALEATSIRPNCSLFEYLLPRKCEDQPSYTLVLSSPYMGESARGSEKTEEKVERGEGVTALRAHRTLEWISLCSTIERQHNDIGHSILQKIMSAIGRIIVVDSPVDVDARQTGKCKYQKKKCHDKSKAKL
ncbi:hypothetical protein C8R42DRAFT_639044 [Lentinula raphanica]|nr:hypothetical protein C8R42DRAFT_639044 [Lentinula raphanica]